MIREKVVRQAHHPSDSMNSPSLEPSRAGSRENHPERSRGRKRKNISGFTLIELMLVVIILGILVAMVVPRLAGRTEQARRAAAQADIDSNLAVALDLYELDNGVYPTTEQGLQALLTEPTSTPVPPGWNGPYLKKKKIPLDPWGRAYVYVCPGTHNTEDYDLYSYGSDGVEGGGDDVTNWEEKKEGE